MAGDVFTNEETCTVGFANTNLTLDTTAYVWTENLNARISSGYCEVEKIELPEGVELMTLYDVYMIYAENRKKPITAYATVLAANKEDAKIKSGLMSDINDAWDTDYLTFVVKCIGEVKTKAKPKEVKTV